MKIGVALFAVGLCICSTEMRAQTATTVTTTKGAVTEFVPGSQTVVVKTETAAPLRYVLTKQTTIVDEAGAPITIERIAPGSPVVVDYTGTGDRLVASRIVVQKPAVVTERETTTTTTRPLTHDEKEAIKDREEKRKDQLKEEIEKEKEALEKAKDKLDDDD